MMKPEEKDDVISIRGAKSHNLKGLNLTIPRDRFVVITGPSGSGKSSLAFDTIYAEGQRRYIESLSAYARQFTEQLSKPQIESIGGLSPTIAIEQRTTTYNPRSTVGTVTELYDYFRLLFARIGHAICYQCKRPIESQSQQQIVDQILSHGAGSKVSLLAPIVRGRKGEYQREFSKLRQQGFVRVRVDGEVFDLEEPPNLDRNKKHDIEVFVDRLVVKGDPGQLASRVSESVELALRMGGGSMLVHSGKPEILHSEKFSCNHCGISYPDPEPRTFSFNSPAGACPTCDGLGVEIEEEDEELEGESEDEAFEPEPEVCSECLGARLRKESLHFLVAGKNIAALSALPIEDLQELLGSINISAREIMIAERVLKEIVDRLNFLLRVGVGYLSLDRAAQTLSGGEAQRIRLATQIGSSMVGVIYVLDEPSIGLHPRDHHRLLDTLHELRDQGNTVLVVEHDRDTMEQADWVLDLGPGAGTEGGELIAAGTPKQIKKSKKSLTGKYLRGDLEIALPKQRRSVDPKKLLEIRGAHQNNLKNVDAQFPLGTLICVTGVSGSGKSTLVLDTLYPALWSHLFRADWEVETIKEIKGLELIDKVVDIDQRPIGKTPRSNPATYTGVFSLVRELFAMLPDAQIRGFKPGRFSFNMKGGRCDDCEGAGMRRVKMHFLPDVFVKCSTCHGARYNRDTMEVRYKGKNISEVLQMTVAEGFEFFDAVPKLKQRLKLLNEVGLGYIQLGQSATTLSGGEAQRMKLAKELARTSTGKTIYILDEPSTGLHFDDIQKLLHILQRLVDQGNTVIVIEHNLDMIKVADYLIDLGPEGGAAGGVIVAQGTPEEVAKNTKSHTGRFLKPYLT